MGNCSTSTHTPVPTNISSPQKKRRHFKLRKKKKPKDPTVNWNLSQQSVPKPVKPDFPSLEQERRRRSILSFDGTHRGSETMTTATGPTVLSRTLSSVSGYPPSRSPIPRVNSEHEYDGKVCVHITESLHLGNAAAAQSSEFLQSHNITHIINCASGATSYDHTGFKYLGLPLKDHVGEIISTVFYEAFDFIDDCRRIAGNCFIHCTAGISRSPTILMAYLMYATRSSFKDVFTFVKSKRPECSPNFGFILQLRTWGQMRKTNVFFRLEPESTTASTTKLYPVPLQAGAEIDQENTFLFLDRQTDRIYILSPSMHLPMDTMSEVFRIILQLQWFLDAPTELILLSQASPKSRPRLAAYPKSFTASMSDRSGPSISTQQSVSYQSDTKGHIELPNSITGSSVRSYSGTSARSYSGSLLTNHSLGMTPPTNRPQTPPVPLSSFSTSRLCVTIPTPQCDSATERDNNGSSTDSKFGSTLNSPALLSPSPPPHDVLRQGSLSVKTEPQQALWNAFQSSHELFNLVI